MYHPEINITEEERERIIESAKELLTKKKVVVHHAKHEYRFAKVCWKFTPNITDDTMYLAYILYMSYPGISYGLKYLSGRFISMPPWEEDVHLYSEVFKKINKYKELTKDKMENLIQEYKKLNLTEEELIRFDNILKDKNYPIRQAESDKSDVFYWMVPVKSLEKYAGYDAVAPLKLMKVLKPMLVKDSGLMNVYDLMMRASNAFANVELMGFRVNDLELWTKRYQDEIDKALKAIREFDEVKKFELETGSEYNPSSSQQNVEVFFHKFQFPVKGTTSKGEPSTSETHIIAMIMELQAIENRSPDEERRLKFLEEFRRYKKLKKLMSSYFIGLREFMRYNDAFDGHKCKFVEEPAGVMELHMHPGYTLHGTECITADSLVLTREGLKPIISLCGESMLPTEKGFYKVRQIEVFDGDTWRIPLAFYVGGNRVVNRIETEDGGVIKCTSEHPLYSDHGWIESEDIVIGTRLRRIVDDKDYYSPVVSITKLYDERVYDLSMDVRE